MLRNINFDHDQRSEPWLPSDFMPGAVAKSDDEDLIEFAEAVARGEMFDEPDPEELSRCRRQLRKTFSNVK